MQGGDEGDIRIVMVPEGWFWVIPFRGHRSSVGVVLEPKAIAKASGDLDAVLAAICNASPVMRVILHGSTQLFAAPINGYGATQSYFANLSLSSGDAIDFEVGFGSDGDYSYDLAHDVPNFRIPRIQCYDF